MGKFKSAPHISRSQLTWLAMVAVLIAGLVLGWTVVRLVDQVRAQQIVLNAQGMVNEQQSFDLETSAYRQAAMQETIDKINRQRAKKGLPKVTVPPVTSPPVVEGERGPSGPQGLPGEDGERGVPGATGSAGPRGIPGVPGPTGERGETGAQGAKGEAGAQGATGATGAQGEKGSTGDKGATGDRGYAVPPIKRLFNNAELFGCRPATPAAADRAAASPARWCRAARVAAIAPSGR